MTTRTDADHVLHTRVALRRELVAEGWTDRQLLVAVRDGVLARPRRGAYVDAALWKFLGARERHVLTARAVMAQAATPVLLSHTSGLALHGSSDWGLDLDTVHITRRDGRTGRKEAGVAQHRGALLPGDETSVAGIPVMTPTRLALEATTLYDVETSLVQVNHLLHHGLTTLPDLRARYARMTQWPDSLTTDLVLRLCDGRCETVGESRTLHLCWRQGLPAPVPQYPVYDERGILVARLDFAWPHLGAFVEFDGRVKYMEFLRPGESAADAVVREKRREDLVRRLTGFRGLRLMWDDFERPEATALLIRRLLFPTDHPGDSPRGLAA